MDFQILTFIRYLGGILTAWLLLRVGVISTYWPHNSHRNLHKHFSSDLKQRSANRLEHLADAAADAQRYDEAISHYNIALSLNPPSTQGILTKRTKAFVAIGSWKRALDDVNEVRPLYPMHLHIADPLSSGGYKDLNVSCRM